MLEKIFIKNYKETDNPEVREKYANFAGIFGLITNILLSAGKMVVGLIGKSFTIIADAINNLSDAGGSVATIIGYKLANKRPDSKHPYGYARYEYITALLVSIMVFAIGVLLGKSSVEKIIESLSSGENTQVSIATYVVLTLAIVGKFIQMLVYIRFSKAIGSEVLKANSIDSRNDIISTAFVLIATIIIDNVGSVGISLDGIFGVAVSVFIVITSLKLIKDTISPLLGEKPDKEFVDKIATKLMSYDGVLGIHDLMIHNYGIGKCFALVHVEVDAKQDILVSHDIIDNIERDFMQTMNLHLCIHLDPIVNDNPIIEEHKQLAIKVLHELNPELSLHDFRMVIGQTHTNVLFDIVLPFDSKTTKEDIFSALNEAFNNGDTIYYFVIDFDEDYV